MKPRASAAEIRIAETPPTFPGDRRRLSGAARVEPPGNARASCDSGEATTTQREEPGAASADCSIAETAPFDARAWRSFSAARFTGTVEAIGFSGSRIRQIWFVPAARPAGASPHVVTAAASFKKSLRAMLEAASALIPSRSQILNEFLNAGAMFGDGVFQKVNLIAPCRIRGSPAVVMRPAGWM